jgi:hypothetical protein
MDTPVQWRLTNGHEDALIFRKRSDDPEYISVYFNAPPNIKCMHVGAGLGVCDYDFENNGMPHRVHKEFARAVWNALVKSAEWKAEVDA